MNQEKKIKDMYGISFNLNDIPVQNACQMNEWYSELINKTYNELNIFDITRMIIQNIFLDLAVSKAISFLEKNPFCGQRYEGELLELLLKLDNFYLKKYNAKLEKILKKALVQNDDYPWLCEEEKKEFANTINEFINKIKV